jgi:ELWxxDGT repeat protein
VLGGSQLLFGASDVLHGLQLWRSDGTATGTTQLSHIGGDRGAVSFAEFFAAGTRVFFAADDGVNGLEPWVYDPVSGGLAFAVPYGTGCLGALGAPRSGAQGLPTVGNTAFALTVDRALPNAPAFLELSVASTNIAIGACRLLLTLPLIDAAARFTDGAGVASAVLPIPASSYLAGLNLFFQWAVVDAGGGLFGVLALSNGMQVQIGG